MASQTLKPGQGNRHGRKEGKRVVVSGSDPAVHAARLTRLCPSRMAICRGRYIVIHVPNHLAGQRTKVASGILRSHFWKSKNAIAYGFLGACLAGFSFFVTSLTSISAAFIV